LKVDIPDHQVLNISEELLTTALMQIVRNKKTETIVSVFSPKSLLPNPTSL
jgi:hypothetical protein